METVTKFFGLWAVFYLAVYIFPIIVEKQCNIVLTSEYCIDDFG